MRVSVDPAADFGHPYGDLVLGEPGADGRVEIVQADPVIYIAEKYYRLIRSGQIGWATLTTRNPWDLGVVKIRGKDRTVIYEVTGTVGPRVPAYLAEMPD